VLHSALLFGLLTGMRSGEICGLMAEDVTHKGLPDERTVSFHCVFRYMAVIIIGA
jgi:citrate lyase alpha subunit